MGKKICSYRGCGRASVVTVGEREFCASHMPNTLVSTVNVVSGAVAPGATVVQSGKVAGNIQF